jgi:mono/diheme cytochrome c family protein
MQLAFAGRASIGKAMKQTRVIIIALSLFVAALCALPASRADETKSAAKNITFNKDVAPIFFKNCAECHRPGENAPFSALSFKDVRPWAKSIREKVASRVMPPWHADPQHGQFQNDRRLNQREIDTITAWVDGGAIEGEAKDLPPAPKFVEGWGIGKPDLVLSMPEAYTVEATGPDEYQYFEVPTGLTEDRYVRAVEARPGNRKVVHHLVVFIQAPAAAKSAAPKLSKEELAKLREQLEKQDITYRDGFLQRVKADAPVYNDGCALPNGGGGVLLDTSKRMPVQTLLTVWAPGRDTNVWEPGMAKKIPAGSKLIFQMHYNKAAGSVQTDRSSIGLIFAKEPPTNLHNTELVFNAYLQIPAGAERHRATACWAAPTNIQLQAIMPHMHVRGAAMEVKAVYPDGRAETLLNVPRYDFSWQTNYSLKQPMTVPKGTRFLVTAWFDNSAKNKFNPDPTKAVRWGEPTYDEMLACFLDYTQDAKATATAGSGQATQR